MLYAHMFYCPLNDCIVQVFIAVISTCVFLLALLFASLFALVRYKRNQTYHIMRVFPGHFENIPLLRSIVRLRSFSQMERDTGIPIGVHKYLGMSGLVRREQLNGQGAVVNYVAGIPQLIVFRTDHVEEVFAHSTNISKSFGYDFLEPWLGKSLLLSDGSAWKSQRKMLTPAFHFQILNQFIGVMNRQAEIFTDLVINKQKDEDLVPYISALTLDVTCETIMGTSLQCQNTDSGLKYLHGIQRLGELFISRADNPLKWPDVFYRFTSEYKELQTILKTVHTFTREVILARKAELLANPEHLMAAQTDENIGIFSKSKKPFLDMLLHKHLKGEFTIEEMRGQVDTFMFAGHDTTSMALTYGLYLIGLHPEVQRKLHEEVDRVFGSPTSNCDVTTEHLHQLKYMDMVIKESQRLFPPVPVIGRKLTEDMTIKGKKVPKGCDVTVILVGLHNDPNVYPKPDEFIPERFSPEESMRRSPFAFTPFSAGPRNCIGQKFALLEEKIVLTWLLRRYEWRSLDPRDKLELTAEIVLKPTTKIRVEFRRRDNGR